MSRANPQEHVVLNERKFEEMCSILGVKQLCYLDPDRRVIEKAFRRSALKCHPDKGGDPVVFKRLNDAYYKLIGHITKLEQKIEEAEMNNSILIEISKTAVSKWQEKLKTRYGWFKSDNCKNIIFDGPYKQYMGRSKMTGNLTLVLYEDPQDGIPKIHVRSSRYMAWIAEMMLPSHLHVDKNKTIQFDQWRLAHLAEFGIYYFSETPRTPGPDRKDIIIPTKTPKTTRREKRKEEKEKRSSMAGKDEEINSSTQGTNSNTKFSSDVPDENNNSDKSTDKNNAFSANENGTRNNVNGESVDKCNTNVENTKESADSYKSANKEAHISKENKSTQDHFKHSKIEEDISSCQKENLHSNMSAKSSNEGKDDHKPFICNICSESFQTLMEQNLHKKVCYPKSDFLSSGMEDVIDSEYRNSDKKKSPAFICQFCDEKFTNMVWQTKHMNNCKIKLARESEMAETKSSTENGTSDLNKKMEKEKQIKDVVNEKMKQRQEEKLKQKRDDEKKIAEEQEKQRKAEELKLREKQEEEARLKEKEQEEKKRQEKLAKERKLKEKLEEERKIKEKQQEEEQKLKEKTAAEKKLKDKTDKKLKAKKLEEEKKLKHKIEAENKIKKFEEEKKLIEKQLAEKTLQEKIAAEKKLKEDNELKEKQLAEQKLKEMKMKEKVETERLKEKQDAENRLKEQQKKKEEDERQRARIEEEKKLKEKIEAEKKMKEKKQEEIKLKEKLEAEKLQIKKMEEIERQRAKIEEEKMLKEKAEAERKLKEKEQEDRKMKEKDSSKTVETKRKHDCKNDFNSSSKKEESISNHGQVGNQVEKLPISKDKSISSSDVKTPSGKKKDENGKIEMNKTGKTHSNQSKPRGNSHHYLDTAAVKLSETILQNTIEATGDVLDNEQRSKYNTSNKATSSDNFHVKETRKLDTDAIKISDTILANASVNDTSVQAKNRNEIVGEQKGDNVSAKKLMLKDNNVLSEVKNSLATEQNISSNLITSDKNAGQQAGHQYGVNRNISMSPSNTSKIFDDGHLDKVTRKHDAFNISSKSYETSDSQVKNIQKDYLSEATISNKIYRDYESRQVSDNKDKEKTEIAKDLEQIEKRYAVKIERINDSFKEKDEKKIDLSKTDVNINRPSVLGPSRFETGGYVRPSSISQDTTPRRNVSSNASNDPSKTDPKPVVSTQTSSTSAASALTKSITSVDVRSPEFRRKRFDTNFNAVPEPFKSNSGPSDNIESHRITRNERLQAQNDELMRPKYSSSNTTSMKDKEPSRINDHGSSYSSARGTTQSYSTTSSYLQNIPSVSSLPSPASYSYSPPVPTPTPQLTASEPTTSLLSSTTGSRAKSEGSSLHASSQYKDLYNHIQNKKDKYKSDMEKAMNFDRTTMKPPVIKEKLPRPDPTPATLRRDYGSRRLERESTVMNTLLNDRTKRGKSDDVLRSSSFRY